MRTYYLFKVNKCFAYIYKKFPFRMYKIVEELYNSKDYNLLSSYKYYKRFAINYDKHLLNNYIYSVNKINNRYYRDNSTHIINNGKYNKLVINSTCLILKTDDIYSIFLNDLNQIEENVFVCDFKNKDYFWLECLNKDRQNSLSLV